MPKGAARVGRPQGSKAARKQLTRRKRHRQDSERAEPLQLPGFVLD